MNNKITVEQLKKIITCCEEKGVTCLHVLIGGSGTPTFKFPYEKDSGNPMLVVKDEKVVYVVTPKPVETEL